MFLPFFRLGVLALEIGERNIKRLVTDAGRMVLNDPRLTSALPTFWEWALLWFASLRPADREQEDRILFFRVW